MPATLALDLGTKTGWAIRTEGGTFLSGTYDMTISPKVQALLDENWARKHDPRFQNLYEFIDEKVEANEVNKVVFEDVQFATYTYQTQLWATFRAAVWAQAIKNSFIAFGCLNTATLKLVATGKGNATKEMMAAWLVRRYPETFRKLALAKPKQERYIEKLDGTPVDDNEVDAYHLLRYFIKT